MDEKIVFLLCLCLVNCVIGVCTDHNGDCAACVADTNFQCGFCGWSGECLTGSATGPTNAVVESFFGYCESLWQVDFASHVIKVQKGYPTNPITADVFLISGQQTTLTIEITRPYGDNVPIDFVIMQDASGSMYDDIDLFGNIAPRIMAGIYAEYKSSYFASNSYCDKPIDPFGDASYGDVVMQFNTPLATDPSAMQIAIKKARDYMGWGNNWEEDPFDACMMSMECQNIEKWRDDSRKFILIVTDAPWNRGGSYKDAKWSYRNIPRNDMSPANTCPADPDGTLDTSTLTYPYSDVNWLRYIEFVYEDDMKNLFLSHNTIPVVGTTSYYYTGDYKADLWDNWGFGRTTSLEGSPDTVLANILAEIEYAAGKVQLRAVSDPSSYVKSISPSSGYTNVAINQKVSFTVAFQKTNPVAYDLVLQALGFPGTDVKIWITVPCFGCDGVAGSGNYVDKCRICNPTNPNSCLGCDGVPYSGEVEDTCGVCGGDNSACAGCDGIPYSGTVIDACNVCGGNNGTCFGCDGKPSGFRYDICGVCGGDGYSCVGCDGVPFSNKTLDKCLICGGTNLCLGCDGEPYSGKKYDNCNVCGGTNDCLGCDGVPFSNKTLDECNICGGDGSSCPLGCDGIRSSVPTDYDLCGVCGGNDECLGCDYIPFSNVTYDLCGICGGENSCIGCDGIPTLEGNPPDFDLCGICGGTNDCLGCDYVPYSGAVVDDCGICGGENLCIGCDGIPYSGMIDDYCGVCGGDGESCVACDGFPFSTAVYDACGLCGGDNSTCIGCDGIPLSKKVKDTCGVCGGTNDCLVQVEENTDPIVITPVQVALIATAAAVALIGGIVAAATVLSIGCVALGPNFLLPSNLLKQIEVQNSEIYNPKPVNENPFAVK